LTPEQGQFQYKIF